MTLALGRVIRHLWVMRYSAYEILVAPARPSAALWRLVLGVVLSLAVMFAMGQSLVAIAGMALSAEGYVAFLEAVRTGNSPFGMLVLLSSLGFMGLGAVLAARALHERDFRSLFGPLPLAWRQMTRVFGALVILYLVLAILPPWGLVAQTDPGLAFRIWLPILPLTLLALLVQTGSEELFFRGYIQSQLAARFAHPAVWIIVPAVLFALGHYAPQQYGSNAVWIALWAFAFGIVAADLTARSGTLGPAVALHMINNFMAIAITSMPGDMSGLALRTLPFDASDEAALARLLPLEFVVLGVSWLAARVSLRV